MAEVNEMMEYDTEGSDGQWPEDISPEDGLTVGYAPGGYLNKCRNCGGRFIGDKRARTCAKCARKLISSPNMKDFFEAVRRGTPVVEPPVDTTTKIQQDTMMECLLIANDVSRQLRDNDDPYERGWTDGAGKAGDNIRLAMERLGNE